MTELQISETEREFLIQSNLIEGEDENIDQPIVAWNYLKKQKKLEHYVITKTHKYLRLDKPYPPPLGYYRSLRQINVSVGGRVAPSWSMVDGLMDNWLLD